MDKARVSEHQASAGDVLVEVFCSNEKRAVGTLPVPSERDRTITSRSVWSGFRPVSEEYRLPRKMQGDGVVLSCPRCGAKLCIKGETKAATEDSRDGAKLTRLREEARRRALDTANMMEEGAVDVHLPAAGLDPGLMPITLGKTKIEASR